MTLGATAVIIAWPILRGGWLTYVDNAVHLAEIHELAAGTGEGWSEIGFTGFALHTLHSPLWYPLLGWLTRVGLPVSPLYAGCLLLGFVAPAFAIYAVARARAGALGAGVLAYVVLVQSTMITGIGSPLGGMWTHALGAAGVILLADLLARPRLGAVGHTGAAALLALIGLTHLFALLMAVVVIGVVSSLQIAADEIDKRELRARVTGWGLAALASAAYWMTFLLGVDTKATPNDSLPIVELASRLFLPTDVLFLLENRVREAIQWDLHLTESIPMVGLIVLGVLGFVLGKGRRDRLSIAGFWFALLVLLAVAVHGYHRIAILGPVSWRLLLWVRLGMALAAIPLVVALEARLASRRRWVGGVLATAGTALGAWWGLPLRRESPPSMDAFVEETRALWSWLAENADPAWGRIYLHDTFGQDITGAGAARSHLLALTAHHSKLPQLGAYYGVVPLRTRWILSEFNRLYGRRDLDPEALVIGMEKTNAGVLVTSSDRFRQALSDAAELERLYDVGRYSVWKRIGARNELIAELRPSNHVHSVEWKPGAVDFHLVTTHRNARVVAKITHHRWWRLRGIEGATLGPSPEGFMVVDGIPVGDHRISLRYQPTRAPLLFSILGVFALAGWGIVRRARERRAPARSNEP